MCLRILLCAQIILFTCSGSSALLQSKNQLITRPCTSEGQGSVLRLRGGAFIRGWSDTEYEDSADSNDIIDESHTDENGANEVTTDSTDLEESQQEKKKGVKQHKRRKSRHMEKSDREERIKKAMGIRRKVRSGMKAIGVILILVAVFHLIGASSFWNLAFILVPVIMQMKSQKPSGIVSGLTGERRHLSFTVLNGRFDKDMEVLKQTTATAASKSDGDSLHMLLRSVGLSQQPGATGEEGSEKAAEKKEEQERKEDTKDKKTGDLGELKKRRGVWGLFRRDKETKELNSYLSNLKKDRKRKRSTERKNNKHDEEGEGGSSLIVAAHNTTAATEATIGALPRAFVLELEGDDFTVKTGSTSFLADATSFLVHAANTTTDEVIIILKSPGGEVAAYGLAAAQVGRLRSAGLNVTVCVDEIAASGGYMVACVANKIIAAPFSMIGSIGVVAGVLNAHRAAKRFGVDPYVLTSGENKAPLHWYGEITEENIAKQQRFMDGIHASFKDHVQTYRPGLDIEAIATGEVWLGRAAKEVGLVDDIGISSDYVQARMKEADVIAVTKYAAPSLNISLFRRATMPFAKFCGKINALISAAEATVAGTSNTPTVQASDGLSGTSEARYSLHL